MSKLMVDKLYEEDNHFKIRIRFDWYGKRKDRSRRFSKDDFSKKEVEQIRSEIITRDAKENVGDKWSYNPFMDIDNTPSLTLEKAVESFLEGYKPKVSSTTFDHNKRVLNYFIDDYGKHTLCKHIKWEDIKEFLDDRCTTITSKSTYLYPFKNLWKHLEQEYGIEDHPEWKDLATSRERRKEVTGFWTILSEEDLWNFVEFCLGYYSKKSERDVRDVLSFILYFYTGLRTEELPWIKLKDLDFKNSRIFVGKNNQTKTYTPRNVWLPEQAHEAVKRLIEGLDSHDYLYDHDQADAEGKIMRSATHKFTYQYKKFFPKRDSMPFYNLRHSCGCWLLEEGFSIMFVKDQLGHRTLDTTLKYARMTGTNQQNEIEKYHRLNSNNGVNRFEQIESKLKDVWGVCGVQ